jgi:hypothetical protein
MRPQIAALTCVLAAGGCQTPPPDVRVPDHQRVVMHPGDATVSAVGTPFYLAFKTAFCAASVAIAAPVAAIAAMSESRSAPQARRDLGDGVAQNCGPPYVLSPFRVVSIEPLPAEPTSPPLAAAPEELPAPAAGGPTELLGPR